MFSDRENVNMLTALLVSYGITRAVVCPGSRNAPIVHNLNECPGITCFPVTDERSAGFYALGMAQATGEPVVVCVTSGSALLNVVPAVAEACYQHHSLIVISADRPAAWIDQLDGQTLQQAGALDSWVARSVSLPEPHTDHERWHCNRLICEALMETRQESAPCVHINVPITEPLFGFTVEHLPSERVIRRYQPPVDYGCLCQELTNDLLRAERPMIIVGQMSGQQQGFHMADYLLQHVIVLHEALSPLSGISHFDEVLARSRMPLPDFVLYVGDALVSKRLKLFLREARDARVWRVSTTGRVEDTFQNLCGIIVGDPERVLSALSDQACCCRHMAGMAYRTQWLHALSKARQHAETFMPDFSQMQAVRAFERRRDTMGDCQVHYANSTAVRLANIYAAHPVWCNRGVNGIEGSLSTACGFSVVCRQMVFCVIGDLSFFYDQNALWNRNLTPNLRILLLNNGKGGIFDHLKGLQDSPASEALVAGQHLATAEGTCRQNGVDYRCAHDTAQMERGLDWLTDGVQAEAPRLLEVVTNAADDARVFDSYYASFLVQTE